MEVGCQNVPCLQIMADHFYIRKHIYSDLQPYICLEKDCITPGQQFSRRHHGIEHMRQHHWVTYQCLLGCNSRSFNLPSECREHIVREHSPSVPEADIDTMIKLSAQPRTISKTSGLHCPLCGDKELVLQSEKQYQWHVGRHQEQLSLFALPQTSTESDSESDLDSKPKSNDGHSPTEAETFLEGLEEQDREINALSGQPGAQANPQTENELIEHVARSRSPGPDNPATSSKTPMMMDQRLEEERREVLALLERSPHSLTSQTEARIGKRATRSRSISPVRIRHRVRSRAGSEESDSEGHRIRAQDGAFVVKVLAGLNRPPRSTAPRESTTDDLDIDHGKHLTIYLPAAPGKGETNASQALAMFVSGHLHRSGFAVVERFLLAPYRQRLSRGRLLSERLLLITEILTTVSIQQFCP